MDNPRLLLIRNVLILYSVMGPLILFALFALFDALIRTYKGSIAASLDRPKDPALWSAEDIRLEID